MARKVAVIRDNSLQEADDSEVDIELRSPSRLFGSHPNIIPLANNTQPTRSFYGSRMANQAMPLENPEAPLIRSLNTETGKSFEEEYGEGMGARLWKSEKGGTVKSVRPGMITVTDDAGEDHDIDMYDNFEFNRKTQLHNRPVVKPGDKVKPGQVLAASNYTDDSGVLAMGKNARIAVVPYKGYSLDDAVVVSESFAKRMTSQHAYEESMQTNDGTTKFGKTHFSSLFPRKFTQEQLDTIGDDGVVKPGTVLHKGDPIILATRPKTLTSETAHLGKLGKVFRTLRNDASVEWEHDYPGYVTDSLFGKKNAKAFITAQVPLKVGDKVIQSRVGQKCYHPDTEFFTDRGWVRCDSLRPDDLVAALFDRNQTADKIAAYKGDPRTYPQDLYARFVSPVNYVCSRFDGDLYGMESSHAAYLVTGNHRVLCKAPYRVANFRFRTADKVHGFPKKFLSYVPFEVDMRREDEPATFEIPYVPHAKKGRPSAYASNNTVFPFHAFVKFLAFYLCEGNVDHSKPTSHRIVITQKERPFCRKLEALFAELGLHWRRSNNQYMLSPNKSLATYLRQFGKARDKFLPEWVFSLSKETLTEMVEWLWQGDGDKDAGSKFYTSSPAMLDGVQRIFTILGKFNTTYKRDRRPHQNWDTYALRVFLNADNQPTSNKKHYYRQEYHGNVYCVQVPGEGAVLTRFHGKVMWNGNSIVSKILPDEQMLRSLDGKPFEILLNPLALPSRINTATLHEIALGKVAAKTGKPIAVPSFGKGGESRLDYTNKMLADNGLSATEEVFDPVLNRKLAQPVSTGVTYAYKLHHVVESKKSARGQGSYSLDEQPVKGGGENAQAKRLGGLEVTALLAKGGYDTLREATTLRGQSNRDYWSMVRQGFKPHAPGVPFVFNKFLYLLNGAGINVHDEGRGRLRLKVFTDRDLRAKSPRVVRNGGMVDGDSLEGIEGGLFDKNLVAGNSWGSIPLVEPMLNPAAEQAVLHLLGMKEKDLRSVLAGEMDIDEARGLGNKR